MSTTLTRVSEQDAQRVLRTRIEDAISVGVVRYGIGHYEFGGTYRYDSRAVGELEQDCIDINVADLDPTDVEVHEILRGTTSPAWDEDGRHEVAWTARLRMMLTGEHGDHPTARYDVEGE